LQFQFEIVFMHMAHLDDIFYADLSYLILNMVILLLSFLFLSKKYSGMLENATTPWYLNITGEFMIYLLYKLGTISRKYFPQLIFKQMQLLGQDKVKLLLTNPPPSGSVCFIGSSTFTYWRHLSRDFAALHLSRPVFNAAFGGSCTCDLIPLIDDLCTRYNPSVIVYFCGMNNIAQALSPDVAKADFEVFAERVYEKCPASTIVYLGITTTPFIRKWNVNNSIMNIKRCNVLVREYVQAQQRQHGDKKIHYIDTDGIEGCFVRDEGMFLGDRHHLNDEGHQKLAELLFPLITRCLSSE
jgi:hypothetical protein